MSLTPQRPPGHANRKARAFESEMRLLREEGYTLQAIREALAEAGVRVSKSTVQRELTRPPRRRLAAPPPAAAVRSARPQLIEHAPAAVSPTPEPLSGREIAEAFASTQITNPLLRAKHTLKEVK